jgi:hypothetical protein
MGACGGSSSSPLSLLCTPLDDAAVASISAKSPPGFLSLFGSLLLLSLPLNSLLSLPSLRPSLKSPVEFWRAVLDSDAGALVRLREPSKKFSQQAMQISRHCVHDARRGSILGTVS